MPPPQSLRASASVPVARPPSRPLCEAPGDRWPFKGWQRLVAHARDKRAYEMHFFDHSRVSRAASQAGPFAARVFNVTPPRDDVSVPSALFRVLLLRRLLLSQRAAGAAVVGSLTRSATTAQPAPHPVSSHPGPAPRAYCSACVPLGRREGRSQRPACRHESRAPVADARRIEVPL